MSDEFDLWNSAGRRCARLPNDLQLHVARWRLEDGGRDALRLVIMP